MPRSRARVDANQPSIVEDLRKLGASVLHIHMVARNSPDIVVGYRGKNYLFEIKIEKGRLRPGQRDWHQAATVGFQGTGR